MFSADNTTPAPQRAQRYEFLMSSGWLPRQLIESRYSRCPPLSSQATRFRVKLLVDFIEGVVVHVELT